MNPPDEHGHPAPPSSPELDVDTQALLEEWRALSLKASGRHSAACDYYERLDAIYGVGSTVLAAIVGSTVFVTLQHATGEAVRIIAGLIGVTAAIASGIQTTAKYAQRAERHRQASRQYAATVRQIAELRALPPPADVIQHRLDTLRKILDDTGAMAPNVPPRIWYDRPLSSAKSWAQLGRKKMRTDHQPASERSDASDASR